MVKKNLFYTIKVTCKYVLASSKNSPCIVCACANHAHGKDGVVSYFGIAVVGELAERVEDVEFGIGDRNETKCQRHSAADHWLTVTELQAKIKLIFAILEA